MKWFERFLFILFFFTTALSSHSQFIISPRDSIISLSSASQIISVSSNNFITSITLTPIKLKNKTNGVSFQFSTKEPYRQTGLIADSFLLKSTNNNMFINHLIEDSVHYNKEGGLDYEFTFLLDKIKSPFFQQETINSIVFFINGNFAEVNFPNKSKNKIKVFFKENFIQ